MNENFSRIIHGCMSWGSWGKNLSGKEMIASLHHSIEHGITTFDHADIYGDYTTESAFGKAFAASRIERDELKIISKCGIQYVGESRNNKIKHYQYDADYIVWSAERSIKELKVSYLDLFLLHRPSPLMHPEEVAKAIDKLKSEGKIKMFGVSNFSSSQTALMLTTTEVEVNQIEFSVTSSEALHDGTLDFMMQKKITPMCWSPLGKFFKEKSPQTDRLKIVLEELSELYEATADQLLLAWILKHPSGIHPVIGTTNFERISAAVEAQKIELSNTDWFKLLVASQGHKVP